MRASVSLSPHHCITWFKEAGRSQASARCGAGEFPGANRAF